MSAVLELMVRRKGQKRKSLRCGLTPFSNWLFISRVPSCLLSSKFHSVGFWQCGRFFRALSHKQLPLLERADECVYTTACTSCEDQPTMVALATRVNLVFVRWLTVKENHFLAFNQGENTNCMALLEAQNSIMSVRCEDSCNLGEGSETSWVVGTLICKVFVVRILRDHWLPSLF